MKRLTLILLLCTFVPCLAARNISISAYQPVYPVLINKAANPVLRLTVTGGHAAPLRLVFSLKGSTRAADVEEVSLLQSTSDGLPDESMVTATTRVTGDKVGLVLPPNLKDTVVVWCSVRLNAKADIRHRVMLGCSDGRCRNERPLQPLRLGVAVRQAGEDGVHTSRIPGLATTADGTLLAIYDARRENGHDLQGNIDIALRRSTDGGQTWQAQQTVLDMHTWGGLPERYNGVSDACILVDRTGRRIFVAGLWMHGILDYKTGRWVEGLTADSTRWSHQWKERGSQPGLGVRETCQLLLTQSTDDGRTWSSPANITAQVKKPEWWLFTVARGQGIALHDGTLVFPSQGRDAAGEPFSNIMWSADNGSHWTASAPAATNTTECAVAELGDGSLMLNMRDNRNRRRREGNGRAVYTTRDTGRTWTKHPTSHKALIEPVCMAALHRHEYTEKGCKKAVLLFCNPKSYDRRKDMTLRCSLDDGTTWQKHALLLDEGTSAGYSCITSVNGQTVGVLYESSRAQLVFQSIPLRDLLQQK